ncbi:unnamed protein product [Pedinophyceae sp. YPF-701]|nr:unnamed protein product [Pedinophyceae sp. YPF-701]
MQSVPISHSSGGVAVVEEWAALSPPTMPHSSADGAPDDPSHVGSAPRRSARCPAHLVDTFPPPLRGVRTLHAVWESAATRFGGRPFLGSREKLADGGLGGYKWTTYAEAAALRSDIASGLLHAGVLPGPGHHHVAVMGRNSPEWCLMEAACHAISVCTVPIYEGVGAQALRFILKDADLQAIACSQEGAKVLLDSQLPPSVKLLVMLEGPDPTDAWPEAGNRGLRILSLDSLARVGRSSPHPHRSHPPKPSDLATIVYTSGTTGEPKGVMHTHASLIANSAGTWNLRPNTENDVYLSYLPLAHIFERVVHINLAIKGTAIGFYSGEALRLFEDMLELKPTILASVPRVLSRMHSSIVAAIDHSARPAQLLFRAAYEFGRHQLLRGQAARPPPGTPRPIMAAFQDLVMQRLREKFGGRLRFITCGSAPLREDVAEFLRVTLCPALCQGYGTTEAGCTVALAEPYDGLNGHVGPPVPCCEVKLASRPDLGYMTTDRPYPRGEILVRGPSVFKGYYKQEGMTREVLQADGWLRTRDIGEWIEGGRLRVIDRIGALFKLSRGEYVSPEVLEAAYLRAPAVMQCFVAGDPAHRHPVAVVVPNLAELEKIVADVELDGRADDGGPQSGRRRLEELIEDPRVLQALMDQMIEEGERAGLRKFEQIRGLAIVLHPFNVSSGVLTPTFKLRREAARRMFASEIERAYSWAAAADAANGSARKQQQEHGQRRQVATFEDADDDGV